MNDHHVRDIRRELGTTLDPRRRGRVPLEVRLPLFIGALLLAIVVGMGYGAYAMGRRAAVDGATQRLGSVSEQLRDLFQQSATQLRTLAAASARKLAGSPKSAAALAYDGPAREQVVATQLRDGTGRVITSTGAWSAALDSARLGELTSMPANDSVLIAGFRVVNDSLVYPVVARVPDGSGYLVYWRKLSASRRAREQLTRLIGSEAALYLGSPSTGNWTDMETHAPPPVVDRARMLAAAQRIAGTPWELAVHFPLAPVMAPARALLRRIAALAAIALLLGLFGTWWITRYILRSLEATVQLRTAELSHVLNELRDAQETIVRKEKLATLGQLASGVGHELRNPLGVMTNAVYFLRLVLPQQAPQVTEYLDILQQQITLSEKIVSDLLDFARLKQPQRKLVSLGDVTRAQIARLGSTNGVSIENGVDGPEPKVLIDEVQIGQVVFNLLTNAVQAMDGAGRIVIRARRENGSVHYEVADNGPGIAPENLGKIFEPLFTTKARGIGLGLAVSRTLARANDGDLTVTSAAGQGATFHLKLPVATEVAA